MNSLRTMKLSTMLSAGFALIIIIGFLVALFARSQLVTVGNNLNYLANIRLANLLLMQQINDNMNDATLGVRDMILNTEPKRIQAKKQHIDTLLATNDDLLKVLNDKLQLKQSHDLLMALNQIQPDYANALQHAINLAATGQQEQAREHILSTVMGLQGLVVTTLDDMIKEQSSNTIILAEHNMKQANQAGTLLLFISTISALCGILIAWAITRTVWKQLGGEPAYAMEVTQRVSQAKLAHKVNLRAGDSQSLLANMNTMRLKLQTLVRKVRGSGQMIAANAREVAAGSADLSQRTGQQAASLKETAASMEQISQTIRQNADTVRSATHLAHTTSATAAKSGEAVNHIVQTMQAISTRSHKIGDIISVIDSITFQTSILALNAAVEAARAGEQGRGFAVVAGEVRSLAQRSSNAAKEIKQLIDDSVSTIEQGVTLVGNAGKTIYELVKQARDVAEMINEIGITTEEQEKGINLMNNAIAELDRMTQQNAALVEQSANAASCLQAQSSQLVQLIQHFELEEEEDQNNQMKNVAAPLTFSVTPLTLASTTTENN